MRKSAFIIAAVLALLVLPALAVLGFGSAHGMLGRGEKVASRPPRHSGPHLAPRSGMQRPRSSTSNRRGRSCRWWSR